MIPSPLRAFGENRRRLTSFLASFVLALTVVRFANDRHDDPQR